MVDRAAPPRPEPPDGTGADPEASAPSPNPRARGRRRRRTPPAPSRPAIRAADGVVIAGTVALLAWAPMAWGSVEPWSRAALVGAAAGLAGVWLATCALLPEARGGDRAARSVPGRRFAGLLAPLAALAAVAAVQLLPLGGLVALVSPRAAELHAEAGSGLLATTLTLDREATLRASAQLVSLALLFLALLDVARDRGAARLLTAALIVLGFAHAVGGILWHYAATGRPYFHALSGSSFGPYVNRNHFAALMGMTIPLTLGYLLSLRHRVHADAATRPKGGRPGADGGPAELRTRQVLAGFAAAVMTGALALSLSRGGIVATLVSLSIVALAVGLRRQTRSRILVAASAIGAALAFGVWIAAGSLVARLGTLLDLFGDASAVARAGIWADTLRMAADFPLFGAGFGSYASVYPGYQTVLGDLAVEHAHNDWLQLVAEGGLAGALAATALGAAFLATAVRWIGRRRDREAVFLAVGGLGGLMAFALQAVAEFSLRVPANALWLTVLAALTLKSASSRI